MKLRLTFKTPEALGYAAERFGREEARRRLVAQVGEDEADRRMDLPPGEDEEVEELIRSAQEYAAEKARKWLKWGEFVDIEIDLANDTATVIPAGR